MVKANVTNILKYEKNRLAGIAKPVDIIGIDNKIN